MITTTSIRIDGRPFQLSDEQDVAQLKADIVAAVSGPSRFVEFATIGQGGVSVLVTGHSAIHFEVRDHEDVEPGDAHPSTHLDLDLDLDLHAFS
jgi:hypothetical protein